MNLDNNLALKEKQSLGADYTNQQRKSKTELEIKKAIIDMKNQGIKINISSVAKFTNKNRITIRKYKEILEREKS